MLGSEAVSLGATFTLSLSTICEGKLRAVYRWHLPVMMGGKPAGIKEACGDGLTSLAPRDRVFASMDKTAMGAFTEYAVVLEALLARMPDAVSFEATAGVPWRA